MRPISEIAELVRDRRVHLRLSQRAAAIAAGVSPTTWQSLEKHHQAISEMTWVGMAKPLRWPVDWYDRLLAGEDPAGFPDVDHGAGTSGDDADDLKRTIERLTVAVERLYERLPPADTGPGVP